MLTGEIDGWEGEVIVYPFLFAGVNCCYKMKLSLFTNTILCHVDGWPEKRGLEEIRVGKIT